jgi:hypothetical protein
LAARVDTHLSDVARLAAATRTAVAAGDTRPPLDPGFVAALESIA